MTTKGVAALAVSLGVLLGAAHGDAVEAVASLLND